MGLQGHDIAGEQAAVSRDDSAVYLAPTGRVYQEWMHHLPVAIYTIDAAGYITYFNQAAARLWGRMPEPGKDRWSGSLKLYRQDGSAVAHEDSPMAKAIREQRQGIEDHVVIERPDGDRRLVKVYPRLIFDAEGVLQGGIGMLIDITAITRSEENVQENEHAVKQLEAQVQESTVEAVRRQQELNSSEERYHRMIEEVEDYAILLLDTGGIIQNWNTGAEKIKGYKSEEIVGKHFRVFYTSQDREDRLPEKLIEEASGKGKAIHEGWRQRKDGSLFWGSIVITALHAGDGRILGFSKVTRDLTARKVAEDKMRRYAADLEFQNRELQQFAYAAAHDMKEPLRKLRYYHSILLEGLSGSLPEKDAEYLRRSGAAAAWMQTLIDDLLTYARASAAGEAVGDVDLEETAREAIIAHQDLVETSGAVIRTENLPVIRGIAFQLRQLFDNLLGNALKYRHAERAPEIVIACKKTWGPLEEGAGDEQEYYEISMTDNGIGFEEEKAGKIFEIFQRLHVREHYPGTGIGLAICKRVVQNHKGFIQCKGVPGQGSIFTIFIPCHWTPERPPATD